MPALPKISILVNFYNMRREAKRTLHSLLPQYQQEVTTEDYEVIAIDNGSTQPLDGAWVESLGSNFQYRYVDTTSTSPCEALNAAVQTVQYPLVMCCIDGARILSPGMLRFARMAAAMHDHPFIYSIAMHLGDQLQNTALELGYDQGVEDALLATVDWERNGYQLFQIATLGGSSSKGYFSPISESNCFALRTDDYRALGGFDEKFRSRGGGLANLDFLNRILDDGRFEPFCLLGEATFHQFHGGVATNVPMQEHPWAEFAAEYQAVRGRPYVCPEYQPICLGCVNRYSLPLLSLPPPRAA